MNYLRLERRGVWKMFSGRGPETTKCPLVINNRNILIYLMQIKSESEPPL